MAAGRNWKVWGKLIGAGAILSIGGPAFTYWLTPTEEQIRARYSPELRERSMDLEAREERQQEFDDFVTRLKEYSKSDKPIWVVLKEEEERKKKAQLSAGKTMQQEADARREEMRREAGLSPK
jgi:hypothetical protein